MNKLPLFTLFLAFWNIALMASCTNSQKGEESTDTLAMDSAVVEEIDTTPLPMFLLGNYQNLMEMVYWAEVKEPEKTEETAEYYDEIHQSWALQEMFRRNTAQYNKLIVDGTKTIDVKYVDEILLNPDGEPMYPGELHSRHEIPSPGGRFALAGESALKDGKAPGVVVVTDSYLTCRKPMAIKPASEDKKLPLPASVIKQMEEKYGMKAERSLKACIIGDRYTYGVMQFKGEYKNSSNTDEDYKSALALEILLDGDSVYSYPVEGWYDPDRGPTWNVDDGGEYAASHIEAAFEGPHGPELCFLHWAPESATTGLLLIRDGKLTRQQYAVYHSLIDETFPIWNKDIAEMKRLYVAEDPHENKNVKLTKWSRVYIDHDGEQVWISDKDEENGAFFSREDGKFKLITTVRANLKPSFPESKGGNHYLMVSGSAGGPAYYTEVFKLKNGKVIEKFTAMEVYGELDECTLNGKTISAEKGKAYLAGIPETTDNYIFWQDIIDKK